MDFDPNSYVVGGVSLIAVVFGLTEFIKSVLAWEGKKVTILASVLGILLMVTYQLQSFLPSPYSEIYRMVIVSLTFGLSASGFYKFIGNRIGKKDDEPEAFG